MSTPAARLPLHPLFDDRGLYWLASHSVWPDDGGRGIRDHFLGLRQDALRARQEEDDPTLAPEWGYGEEADAKLNEIRQRRLRRRAPAEPQAPAGAPKYAEAAGGREEAPTPALVALDLQAPVPELPEAIRSPRTLFTGIDDDLRDLSERVFQVDVHQRVLAPADEGRACLALLFTLDLLRALAPLVGRPPVWRNNDEGPALRVIGAALAHDALAPERCLRDPAGAGELATLLSRAPGLRGEIQQGRFRRDVPFKVAGAGSGDEVACPGPQRGTWLVFCKGPGGEHRGR